MNKPVSDTLSCKLLLLLEVVVVVCTCLGKNFVPMQYILHLYS